MTELIAFLTALQGPHWLMAGGIFVLGYIARHKGWNVPLLPKAAPAGRSAPPLASMMAVPDLPPPPTAAERAANILQDAHDKALVGEAERLAQAHSAPKT